LPPHSQPLPAAEQSVPQSSEWPQPSPMVPQYWPPEAVLQVNGVHAGGWPLHRLSWQVHPVFVHAVPQLTVDPHPSPMSPQYWAPFAVVQARGAQFAVGPALHKLPWQSHPAFAQVVVQ
jgi:hypothetical protein